MADLDPTEAVEKEAIIKRALGLGKQYHLQGRIHSSESISKTLFESALQLAANRTEGLTGSELVGERKALAGEIHDVLLRIDAVAEVARI